jgi:hypothetical protein
MKKIIITISLVLPILLSAVPVFAALSTVPVGSTNFNDLQVTVTSLDNRRVILVDPSGIVVGDTRATHGFPYPFADGTYSMGQLGFTSAGTGTYTIITTYQNENGYGSCTPGSTMSSCLYMIGQGVGYYSESTFDLLIPPPETTINSGDLSVPTSTTNDLLASISNVIGNAGFLGILVVAMALPLFFWFAKEAIALNRHNKKKK